MNLEREAKETILKELTKIGYLGYEAERPTLDNRRAFAKTPIFQKLRKNELTNEEFAFIMNNFIFEGREISEFIVKFVKDLTLSKFIEIGGLDYMVLHNHNLGRLTHSIIRHLLDNIKMENYSEEMSELLDYVENSERLAENLSETKDLLMYIIQTLIDNETAHTHNNREIQQTKVEILEDNYKRIFNLLTNKERYELTAGVRTFYKLSFMYDVDEVDFFDFVRYIKNEDQEETLEFLVNIASMPYIDFEVVKDFIRSNHTLDENTKVLLLYFAATANKLDPTANIAEILNYIEAYHTPTNPEMTKAQLFALITRNKFSDMDRFSERLAKDLIEEEANREIRQEFFDKYYAKLNGVQDYRLYDAKLQMMVLLNLGDRATAELIKELLKECTSYNGMCAKFKCNPADKTTYPGPLTLNAIVGEGYTHIFGWNEDNIKDELEPLSNEERTKLIFEKHLRRAVSDLPITWEMANSSKFLASVFKHLKHQPFWIDKLLSKMNLRNIGFRKYMQVLEDKTRESGYSTHRHMPPTFRQIRPVLVDIPEVIIEIAPESELYMYRHKINSNQLLKSKHCPFSIIKFYLNSIDKAVCNEDHILGLKHAIVSGLEDNNNLTTEERVEVLTRIGYDKRLPHPLYNVKNQDLTVADFQSYYRKVRG